MNKVYSAKQVTLSWGPVNLNDGAPETGTFCEVTPSSPRATQTALLGGGAVINLRSDSTGTIAVTLTATANANDQLTRRLQDQIDNSIPVALPIQVKDNSGRTIHSCAKAVLEGFPTDTYAEEVGARTWVFLCPGLAMAPKGGNDL